ncbi:YcxB family protein [Methylobacterium sp. BTF04]|nr:YcxB family protein [Methylobacterium sp. BTF04]
MLRHFHQQKLLHDAFEITLDRTGVNSKNQRIQMRFDWKDYVRWREDNYIVLIYQSDISYQMIPKRAVSAEQLEDIRFFALAAGVPGCQVR